MNTTPTDAVVLKTHALGRVKTPAARREQLLDEFEQSGMSGVQFAEFRMGKLQRGRAQLSAERAPVLLLLEQVCNPSIATTGTVLRGYVFMLPDLVFSIRLS